MWYKMWWKGSNSDSAVNRPTTISRLQVWATFSIYLPNKKSRGNAFLLTCWWQGFKQVRLCFDGGIDFTAGTFSFYILEKGLNSTGFLKIPDAASALCANLWKRGEQSSDVMWLSILHLAFLWWRTKDCLATQRTRCKTYLLKQVILSSRVSNALLSRPVSTLTVFLSQLWKWFGKLFSLWASVGRFEHRKSLSLADDVTVVEDVGWGTVTQPPPHMHAELSRGMLGQSLRIDHQGWNARYRNGKLNSHRRCGGLFFRLSRSSCEISRKKKLLGLLEGKKCRGVEEMRGGCGHLSLVWGLEVREMAQNKKFPL